jgi:hypothetical protein
MSSELTDTLTFISRVQCIQNAGLIRRFLMNLTDEAYQQQIAVYTLSANPLPIR